MAFPFTVTEDDLTNALFISQPQEDGAQSGALALAQSTS